MRIAVTVTVDGDARGDNKPPSTRTSMAARLIASALDLRQIGMYGQLYRPAQMLYSVTQASIDASGWLAQ